MTLLLDTSEVAPEDRRAAWIDVHRASLFPLVVDFADRHRFRGRAQMHSLGQLSLLRFSGDASIVRRTRREIALSDPEHLQLALSCSGNCEVIQRGRSATLSRGDLTAWDSSHPFTVPHRGSFDLVILSMPTTLVGAGSSAATARLVNGGQGAGAIAGALLRETWRQLESGALAPDDPDMQDALIALGRALLRRTGSSPLPHLAISGLAAAARAYALRHLGDVGLAPATIARAHHVSLRHLQTAFAREGETVSGWLRQTRLEHIRADLANPALGDVGVGAIGARWGMTNHAHMTRAFRSEFGSTPSEFRRSAQVRVPAAGRFHPGDALGVDGDDI